MRIVLDARYLDGSFSGIGTYSQQLIEHLAEIDTENQYYVIVRPGFTEQLRVGKNFEVLTYRAAPVSAATLFRLGKLVDSLNPDLMHSFFPLAPLRMKTPLMVTMHDLQPFLDPDFSARRPLLVQSAYSLFYRTIYPAVMNKAKWVVNVSYHTRDQVADLFPEFIPKLVVVTSGLDKQVFEPSASDFDLVRKVHQLDNPYVLYYGSTRPNKNIPMTIRGFGRYVREHGDTETEFILILKKDRFFRDIAKAIQKEGLADRVRVLDQVSPEDRRVILSNARAFLFATKYEGFGFPALEAMAAGVPVLVGKSGALEEICCDAAQFVNPDDPEDMAEAMALLLKNEEQRTMLIDKGIKRAGLFDWKEAAERVYDIYRLLF